MASASTMTPAHFASVPYAGVWCSDDLSTLKVDGQWSIVHKTFYPHPAR
jgi:hypothetical protein